MSSPGFHYTRLLNGASPDQMAALCPGRVRPLLEEAMRLPDAPENLGRALFSPVAAARDEDARRILLDLLERQAPEKLSELADRVESRPDRESILRALESRGGQRAFLQFVGVSGESAQTPAPEAMRIVPPEYALRHYQLDITRRAHDALSRPPHHSAMLHMPTGAGKTRTAMSVVTRHFREHGPTSVIWFASTMELIDQAAGAFEQAWKAHGDTECELWLWRGNNENFDPDFAGRRNRLLVAGLQKLCAAQRNNPALLPKLGEWLSLIVFDEAHQSVAPRYRETVERLRENGNCRLLGLSATPGRADTQEDADTRALIEFYGRQKISIAAPDGRNPVEFLTAKGYLAKASFHQLDFEFPENAVNLDGDDYGSELLDAAGLDLRRNLLVAEKAAETLQKHRRVIVFSPSVASAQFCAAWLNAQNPKSAYALDASTPELQRESILSRFREDGEEGIALFNFGILTAGFDAPRTSAVIIARPTKSVILYSQMVGRAIRGVESGGNQTADIFTVADLGLRKYCSVATAFQNWEKSWDN